jgi:SH3-like domain-containing protein
MMRHRVGFWTAIICVALQAMSPAMAVAEQPGSTAPPARPVIQTVLPAPADNTVLQHDPTKGAVTNLPVPRYVSLKTNQGNARRGPGLSHRVDWVFTRAGVPLRVTAEYENWRRIEDAEGVGGWVHYTLLSGVRAVLVTQDMAEFRSDPVADAMVVVQSEQGVVGKLLECNADWCRVALDGYKGWVLKSSIWGVDPGEIVE